MKKIIYTIAIMALFSSLFSISGDDILSGIKTKIGSIKTFEADFTQVQIWELAEEESKVSGKLYMKDIDIFRVELDNDFIFSDGKTVWRYSSENAQVLIENIKDNDNTILPGQLIFEFTDIYEMKDFFEKMEGEKKFYVLNFVSPEGNERFINKLKVKVNEEFIPVEIACFDLDDNKTTYYLSNSLINQEIAPEKFLFTKPDKVEIIDLRKK
ncbi:MAG: outer membrane lipoprotein chaperone LolA [Candidatus Delongbacteria bacterium]|jgi:chaperone LolA|nr:outer membrane lipoprotein chaperone LolA [Candidatus Delongbacteria bacterium]